MKFNELGLDNEMLKSIEAMGFDEATPIQSATIPLTLTGKDVIGQAQTGTGKTAAFGIPLIQNIDPKDDNIQALIISPTRELAMQTQQELYRLGKDKHARVQVVYGGSDIRRQIRDLKRKPQILVGTPGRLLDHINRHTVKLGHVKTLVLDEADEMLDMGFVDDIEKIVAQTPSDRQTLLFSATIPPAILKIGKKFMTDPETVKVESKELTADLVEQYYVRTKENEKFDVMTRLFTVQRPKLTLIFGRTKRRVDELTRGLKARGYRAEGLHGDLSQQKRTSVLRAFKNGELDMLVATDVAARGLDISGVTHVYNFDIPQDPESYVHRIGRTGRAGKSGVSVTFVTNNEMGYLRTIEKLTHKRMLPLKPPTYEEAFEGELQAAIAKAGNSAKEPLDKFKKAAETLLAQYPAEDLVAAYLQEISKENLRKVTVRITPERPLPARKQSRNHRGNGGGNRRYDHRRGGSNHRNNDRHGSHDRSRRSRDNNGRNGGSAKKHSYQIH